MKTISKSKVMKMLGGFVSVENAPSRNGYNAAPNQFILTFENGKVFQSYRSLVGVKIGRGLFLTSKHDYSNTTSGYCGRWCGMNCTERRKGLKDGSITFIEV